MAQLRDDNPLKDKLEEIRSRLTGDPSYEELSSIQLHMDLLEKWARMANMTDADHQHNHMNDHDNTAFVDPIIVMQASEKQGRD